MDETPRRARSDLTPRQAAKVETSQRIKELALAQLATSGAGELSLRAIARQLNLVSSAMYRYFPSRDDLLTALIVDAYDDLAATLENVPARNRSRRRAWVTTALELREWAITSPHRFALIYGSPIPGYVAPQHTVASAGRVASALLRAGTGGRVAVEPVRHLPARLTAQLDVASSALGTSGGREEMLLLAGAFARLIGALTLELGGHFVGTFEPADKLYAELVEREADALGL